MWEMHDGMGSVQSEIEGPIPGMKAINDGQLERVDKWQMGSVQSEKEGPIPKSQISREGK